MDSEDRDHFKTIAAAPVVQRVGSQRQQSGENSHSAPDPAYCLRRTQLLLSCYRKDEVHDPDVYSAAVAATLGDFPKSVVDYVTDPRTGLPSELKFLPNVAEVRDACARETARQDRLSRPVRKAAPAEKIQGPPPGQDYFSMFEKYGRPIGRFEKPGDYPARPRPEISADERMAANRAYFERECVAAGLSPSSVASPSLLRLLAEKDAEGAENELG